MLGVAWGLAASPAFHPSIPSQHSIPSSNFQKNQLANDDEVFGRGEPKIKFASTSTIFLDGMAAHGMGWDGALADCCGKNCRKV
jgi:hypothetical protein